MNIILLIFALVYASIALIVIKKLLPPINTKLDYYYDILIPKHKKLKILSSQIDSLKPTIEILNTEFDTALDLRARGKSKQSKKLIDSIEERLNELENLRKSRSKKFTRLNNEINKLLEEYDSTLVRYSKIKFLLNLCLLMFFMLNVANLTAGLGLIFFHISTEYYTSLLQVIIALVIALYLGANKEEHSNRPNSDVLGTSTRITGITWGIVGVISCLIYLATGISTLFLYLIATICALVLVLRGMGLAINAWR